MNPPLELYPRRAAAFAVVLATVAVAWPAYTAATILQLDGSGTTVADIADQGDTGTIAAGVGAAGTPAVIDAAPSAPVPVSPPDGATIAAWNVPLTVHVSDPEGQPLQVTFLGRQLAGTPAPPFRIVAVPDTQYYSQSYPQTFTAQTQWIVNHRVDMNIAYVAHEGDIVNTADQAAQWQNANTALSIFDTAADLPFGLCVGNHDENPNGSPSGTAIFNSWFPYTRYQGRPWYGGHYGTTNDNHYILFTAGGMDFIAIHLPYDPSGPAAALTWAGNLLQTYSARRAIVVAHSILNVASPGTWTTQGAAIYNALKGYPNLFLMLCGHNHGEARRTDLYAGTVYSLLADYQSRSNGGDGWLRILEFVPADNTISVKTYSPTLNQYETDGDSQFTLTYDMGGALFTPLGTITDVPSNTDVSLTWMNLEPLHRYEWYATASDGQTIVAGPSRAFTTTTAGPQIALNLNQIEKTIWAQTPLPDDTFTVANVGIGTLNYTITDDADWLSISPAAGVSTGESDPIQIAYDTTGVPVGTHTATITVSADNTWNSPQMIVVTLHVNTVKPDFDGDGDVDQSDFGHLQACFTQSGVAPFTPDCRDADFDGDANVNLNDFAAFHRCFGEPNHAPNPDCAN